MLIVLSRPRFSSQAHMMVHNGPITPALGNLIPLSDLCGHQSYMWYTNINISKTYMHIYIHIYEIIFKEVQFIHLTPCANSPIKRKINISHILVSSFYNIQYYQHFYIHCTLRPIWISKFFPIFPRLFIC